MQGLPGLSAEKASAMFRRELSLDQKAMARIFLLFVFGLGQTVALACSCVTSGSACGALQGTQVVFVGRVIEDSGEGFGKGPAKMAVEEILHGLPKEVREITVETGAGTSCYMRLQKDERYVIYATASGSSGRVSRNFCSFSFLVAGNEALLAALREEQAQGKPRLVGKVQLRTSQFDAGGNGVGGLRVTATGDGTKLDAITRSNGEFELRDVPVGKYHLSVSSVDYIEDQDRFPREDPTVRSGLCEYQNLFVWPDGRIAGSLSDANGKALSGVTVQAFARDRRGELGTSPVKAAVSADDGSYVIRGLPAGDFVVGVNGEKYDDKAPWPPMFYPRTANRDSAQWLHLDQGQRQAAIDLQLASPRKIAVLHIETVFEDGSPAFGAGANVENLEGIQRFFVLGLDKRTGENDQKSVHDVNVYMGETYRVRGFLHEVKSESDTVAVGQPIRMNVRSWKGLSAPVEITAPELRVRVVLAEEPAARSR